jgi:hypothetical protein
MGLEWRIERVEDGALPAQNRHRCQRGADDGEPEARPRQRLADEPAEARLGEHIAQSHDEERREDQRHQHAVGRDQQVVQRFAALRKLDVGDRQRLERPHERGEGERGDSDPDVRGGERVGSRHFFGS